MKLFSMYDAENDGILKLSDFEGIARRLASLRGWKENSSQAQRLLESYSYRWIRLRGDIKKAAHHHLDNSVNLEEWFLYHETLLEDETFQKDVRSLGSLIFDVIDLDENQKIDAQEWANLFQVYRLPVIYSSEVFSKLDEDGDGFLTKEEVLQALQAFFWSQNPDERGNYLFGSL